MKSKLLGLMAVIALLGLFPSAGHALTFDFSFTGGCNVAGSPCTVTGEIDGLTAGATTAATAVVIDTVSSPAFTALSLPYEVFPTSGVSESTSNTFTVNAAGTSITSYDFEADSGSSLVGWFFELTNAEDEFSNGFSPNTIDVISQAGTTFTPVAVGTTPLPAALPLFATGLGAMGLFGWRRKRKAAAIAA
jgi:hypothetical protein